MRFSPPPDRHTWRAEGLNKVSLRYSGWWSLGTSHLQAHPVEMGKYLPENS